MTFEEIVRSFATSETVPVEAIRAASTQRATFVGDAMALLERVASDTATKTERNSVCVMVHVLAEIGDRRAIKPMLELLTLPMQTLEQLFGDAITVSLHRVVMALVDAEDVSALEAILDDSQNDDFAREIAFKAWTYLVLGGRIDRERAKAFLVDYPARLNLESRDFGWSSWVDAIAMLGFFELSDIARRHLKPKSEFDSVFDFPPVLLEDLDQELTKTKLDPDRWRTDRQYSPLDDAVAELSSWYGYSEEFRKAKARQKALALQRNHDRLFSTASPARNPRKEVGRNDPCPCGSGKKFKKCCLQ